MISTEFAPNETAQDTIFALKLMFQPWKWRKGKDITKLRQRLRKRFFSDKNEIHFFLTGRSALYYYLKSLDLPKNSEVLIQAFTCEAVVLPILAQGLKPVYVDIQKEDFSMNFEDVLKKYSPQSKVLILQHTFGITPINRSKILSFAKEKKLSVLEDLAHGFDPGSFNNKNLTSSLLISFGRSKSISGVFGGAIVTRYKKISDYLSNVEKSLQYPSTLFLFKMTLYKGLTSPIKESYEFFIGKILHKILIYLNLLIPEISPKEKRGEYDEMYSKAFPNISALFILQQLNRFNDVLKRRMTVSKYFNDKFRQSKYYSYAYIRFPFITENRDEILRKANRMHMYFGKWYEQIVAPKALQLSKVEYKKGSCPEAEKLCTQILNLPTNITKKEAQKIVNLLKNL